MEERRKLKRQHIMFYSRVFDRKTGMFLGYLGDMTVEGMMLINDKPMNAGERFLLRIDLPEDMYAQSVLNFEAESIWCQPDVDPNFYNTGFQLLGISQDDAKLIEQIVRDYGIREDARG